MVHFRARTRRRSTINEPGHAHELTFTCYRRYPFLAATRVREWLFDSLEAARKELNFSIWAYVVMPEHAHLLVHPREDSYSISAILKAIKEPVGRCALEHLVAEDSPWLTKLTRTRGERIERLFWQSGGGYDRNITEPRTLLKAVEYIHMNPVRRSLVARAADWSYSSAAWYEGGTTEWLVPDRIPAEWLSVPGD